MKKSKPYKLEGKLFRYDFDQSIVEYIAKAEKEDLENEAEWKREHAGQPLCGIDADGYMVLDTIGLSAENWRNKEARDDYLRGLCFDLDEQAACLMANFERYELPYLIGAEV